MTAPYPLFDILSAPLTGRVLVEASAGTGKTWTIAALVVRLIVEEGLEIDRILVVTFTEAATAELRERVRQRLSETLAVFSGASGGDDFLQRLVERHGQQAEAVCGRLRTALLLFDQAAIHTIHGFCQRVLRDRAFEARALFDTELVTDLSDFEEELADDFWRLRAPGFAPLLADYLIGFKFGPDRLCRLVPPGRRPSVILPATPAPDLASAESAGRALFLRLQALWRAERGAIVGDFLACAPGMNKRSYPPEKIVAWAAELDAFLVGESLFGSETGIDKFSAPSANKGKPAPTHPFFALCADFAAARGELESACRLALIALQRDFLLWREAEGTRRKAEKNLRTFDDLLLDVRAAIAGGSGLLTALQESFRAVLIDEFQDTDPVQYAIFNALCPDARSTLYLIGDPKQAIYAFRGADIFTYLEATRHVEHRFTLGVNHRSAPALVSGVNALFRREYPFLFAEIPYPHMVGSEHSGRIALDDGSAAGAPLRLWFVPRAGDKAANKDAALEKIVAGVSAEIVRLLTAPAQLRLKDGVERPLLAGDIAVLVRTNREAAAIQEALRSVGVAAVRQGSESLFASAEAEELLRVLAAIADPGDERLVRGALATTLYGLDAPALLATVDDPQIYDHWALRFRDDHRRWQEHGITAMTGLLLAREHLAARLLGLADGERRLTNLRHAFEVLHRAESEEGLGMEGLLGWFSRHVADPPTGEEYQLRLETDERAVQVVTIHRSKGLEYPVCFVPFCWNGCEPPAQFKNAPFTFHRGAEAGRGELVLDLGSADAERDGYRALELRERLAENLRLFYVAVTRAQARCYVVWGGLKGAESAALTWLLHTPQGVASGAELAACKEAFKALDDQALRTRLVELGEGSATSELPLATGLCWSGPEATETELLPPPEIAPLRSTWRLTSYSALVAGAHQPAEGESWRRAERGEAPASEGEGADAVLRSIHDFPAGAEPGTCLHDILEAIDFTAPAATWRPLVAEALKRYAIAAEWEETLLALLARLVAAPLDPAAPGLRLDRIAGSARCSEMGFFLPVARLSVAGLAGVFAAHRDALSDPRLVAALAELDFAEVEGMLRGFIDLVFVHAGRYYIVDWKSNRLGSRTSDYDAATMAETMLASGYCLQYHLYTLALHRHLAATLPDYDYERHFGGIFYLFLRGIDAACGDCGIVRDRPTLGLILGLDALLGGALPSPGAARHPLPGGEG